MRRQAQQRDYKNSDLGCCVGALISGVQQITLVGECEDDEGEIWGRKHYRQRRGQGGEYMAALALTCDLEK